MTDVNAPRWDYKPDSDGKIGTREIKSTDFNGDGDLDLIIGTGQGAVVRLGREGMLFDEKTLLVEGTEFPTSGLATTDLDGDGIEDLAVSCRLLSCVVIQRGLGDGTFEPSLVVDVPAGDHLATGDIDGDGKADLVGAGDVLWTALSSRRSESVASKREDTTRSVREAVVINEILAINDDVPLEFDEGKKPDWIELYNGSGSAVSLAGWRLELEGMEGERPYNYSFDFSDTVLPADERNLVIFSSVKRGVAHTGFKLPGSGATLTLFDSASEIVDVVDYPEQQSNVSYSRYQDGADAFVFNPIPSPLGANSFDGSPDPDLEFLGLDFAKLKPNEPIRFFVEGKDDLGIIGLTAVYQRLDQPGSPPKQILLYDDGMNEDGGLLDGLFSGVLDPGLPAGAELQFYFVGEDLSGNRIEIPDETLFVNPGERVRTFSLGIANEASLPALEITRVAADNRTGVRDEAGAAADFVEITNNGQDPVSLDGIVLAKRFAADEGDTFSFPAGAQLLPGETYLVFADNNTKQGSRHAPFRIDRGGDSLYLMTTGQFGARVLVDLVETQRTAEDVQLAKISGTEIWAEILPGGHAPDDLSSPWQGTAFNADGEYVAALVFQSIAGIDYQIEYGSDDVWGDLGRIAGDGGRQILTQEFQDSMSFRITEILPPVTAPELGSVEAAAGKTSANVRARLVSDGGELPGVRVFYGAIDQGRTVEGWDSSIDVDISEKSDSLSADLMNLVAGTDYVARIIATNSGGDTWSEAIRFTTLPAVAPELFEVVVTDYTIEGFRVAGRALSTETLTVFHDTVDHGRNEDAWGTWVEVLIGEDGYFETVITELEKGTNYFVGVRGENEEHVGWTPGSFAVRTLTEFESLQRNLLVSEVMYHPTENDRWFNGGNDARFDEPDYEYVELFNAGTAPLSLQGLNLVGGVAFDFANASIQMIEPGEYLLLVANRRAFEARYGALNARIVGEWLTPFRQTKLANSGETIALQHKDSGRLVIEFTYDDRGEWPWQADGNGSSLTLKSDAPGQDLQDPGNWVASVAPLGTPGLAPVREPIIISSPENLVAEEASEYYLRATVAGIPPLNGQWFKDGVALSEPQELGSFEAIYHFQALQTEDSGIYTLVVSNEFGEVTTEPVTFDVQPRSTDPGSLDIAFAPDLRTLGYTTSSLSLPGGKVLLTLFGQNPAVVQVDQNGAIDKSFTAPRFRGSAYRAALTPDGKIVVAGSFNRVGSTSLPSIARLNSDGSLDKSFTPDFRLNGHIADLVVQSDGGIVAVGNFIASIDQASRRNILRVAPNGNLDIHFMNEVVTLTEMTDRWRYSDNGDDFGPEWRTAGFDDSNWQEARGLFYHETAPIDGPTNTPIQLTRGAVTYYFRKAIENPFNREVNANLFLSFFVDDGAVIHLNDEEIFRYKMPTGQIDPETLASPKTINVEEEGPFLVPSVRLKPGVNLIAVEVHQNTPQSSDVVFGLSLKTPAEPETPASLQVGTNSGIQFVEPSPGGKLVIAGEFNTVSGTVRPGIARLHSSGLVDQTFAPAVRFQRINDLAVQADGKVLVSGIVGGRPTIARLTADTGIEDPTFNRIQSNDALFAMALSPDGSIYVTSPRHLLRFLPNGTLDLDFHSDAFVGGGTRLQWENGDRITMTGYIQQVDGVLRIGAARYFSVPAPLHTYLQTSVNLVDWTVDRQAIIREAAGSIHTVGPEAESRSQFYRLQSGEKARISAPAQNANGNLFFHLWKE